MKQGLHITNGDSGVAVIQHAGFEGDFLPWQDVLHVGPVLPAQSLNRFDPPRIQFLSDFFCMPIEGIESDFKHRRHVWEQASEYDAVNLWFEHDLYDQLQLCQVLYLLAQTSEIRNTFHLIQTDHYIGESSSQAIRTAHENKVPINENHLMDAVKVWQAVTHSTPESLLACLNDVAMSLKYMHGAVDRLLSELPHPKTGLSLSQQRILNPLLLKEHKQSELFQLMQQAEEPKFMGDSVFHELVQAMLLCPNPLLSATDEENPWSRVVSLTPTGEQVLNGTNNHINLNGINHWVGGCHLKEEHVWCYDDQNKTLTRSA